MAGRVLLLRGRDPWDPAAGEWWELPGGGIAPGETSAQAAERELAEETGVRGASIGPCVAERRCEVTIFGMDVDQSERLHVAWLGDAEVGEPALEAGEEMHVLEARWWTAADLAATADAVHPRELPSLVADLAAGRVPADPRALDG